jgi:hypothetical protein
MTSYFEPWGMYRMKLKGLWGASLLLVAVAASSCTEEQSAPLKEPTPASLGTRRQEANSEPKVLILATTVAGGLSSREAQAALAWGKEVEIATPEQWKAKKLPDFMKYEALIIGDAACLAGTAAFQAAVDTREKWAPIVDGNVIIMASDPTTNDTTQLVENAVSFAFNRPYVTGLYVALGCAYKDAPAAGVEVELLQTWFGSFKVAGVGCNSTAHMFKMSNNVPEEVISNEITDDFLAGNGCAARSVFVSYPSKTFALAAIATGATLPGAQPYVDVVNGTEHVGTPFVLARGAMALGLGCGNTDSSSGEQCDLGDGSNGLPGYPGQPTEETCSYSCQWNWCGDGQLDPGEECDNGYENGRDFSGNQTACTAFCRLSPPQPTNPPIAVCKDHVIATAPLTCGAAANVNNGSSDPDGDLLGCTQEPAGPYPIGTTLVTLTCTDATGLSASCPANVTVNDASVPTIALVGPASKTLECKVDTYTEEGATVTDLCDDPDPAYVVTGSVNAATPATYTLTYDVTDAAGNSPDAVTRTVVVQDTRAPIAALNGSANEAWECGSPYPDPGVNVSDACVPTASLTITKTGTVNHMVPRPTLPYELTYAVKDPNGNAAPTLYRNVTVRDTISPLVVVNGPLDVTHECGTGVYADPRATATDACDSTLPITLSRMVDGRTVGTFTIDYTVQDDSKNIGKASPGRTVRVVDTRAPTLTVGTVTSPHECGTAFTPPTATAADLCFGNISTSIVKTGAVNKDAVGTYPLTFNVKDAQNNSAPEVVRTVEVQDTLAPSVTMLGASDVTVQCGAGPFADPGASATDACDKTLTVVATPPVDTTTRTTYTVSYSATDDSGHTGTAAGTRTVRVIDDQKPVITLNGSAARVVECAAPYSDPGATANDLCSGTLPVTRVDPTNPNALGNYTVRYNATDGAGLAADEVTRAVEVKDTQAPTVTMVGPGTLPVECGNMGWVDPGATATDACDTSLTVVASPPVDPTVPGPVTVSYSATDDSGNKGTAAGSRTVVVSDTTDPTLTLAGEAAMDLECGTPFAEPGYSANDVCYGDLSGSVDVAGGVNHKVPAPYTLTYTVVDGAGNSPDPKIRMVTVRDTLVPTITVLGPTTDTLACGSTYTDPGATATDVCDTSVTVTSSRSGDPTRPGPFTISYTATDDSGNTVTAGAARTVNVEDNAAPVLVLNPASATLECGTDFVDPLGTANDACYGDLTGSIVVEGTVNKMVPSPYTLTYKVTDASNNTATQTRTVTVQDTQKPVVTVTGPTSVQHECGSGPYADPGATAADACDTSLTVVASPPVDPTTPSTVTVKYSATDDSGNTGTSATGRTVTVADTLPPTLTLKGATPLPLECGTDYLEPGATANDLCAGNISSLINISGAVNKMVPATYPVTYTVTDAPGGRTATQVRSVVVDDTLAPAITVVGPLEDSFECGGTYTDPGATASDICDSTPTVTSRRITDASSPGSFFIEYSAVDDEGNSVTSATRRKVTVDDDTAPVIVLNGANPFLLECGTDFVDPMATANDACLGDVTDDIVATGTVNKLVPGPYERTYTVTDAAENTASVKRAVTVRDTLAPSIAVTGPLNHVVECDGSPYVDPGAVASDACAGDLSDDIEVIGGPVSKGSAGSFTLSYKVTDPSGNTAIAGDSRTVTVQDNLAPVLTMLGGSPLSVECGSSFTDPGATANDACEGNLTPRITKSGAVDPTEPNTYSVTYTVKDTAGLTDSETRTVNVSDTLPPSLTLLGEASQNVECGSDYTDPGALATDQCDGDLVPTVTGAVDPDVLATYTVRYNATDSSGRSAPEVSRSVLVRDTLAPTISVTGPLETSFECDGSEFPDPGAVANDQCDTSVPVMASRSGSSTTPGLLTITYTATDDSGNSYTSPTTRKVTVTDGAAPVLSLVGPDSQTVECGTGYTDPGATADDACFGDLTDDITTAGAVNHKVPKLYSIVYSVTDGAGLTASKARSVTVDDTRAPVITLVGSPTETYECGAAYVDPGATANDLCFDDVSSAIVATRTTDPAVPNIFTITYNVTDPDGNAATPVTRTVSVNDTAPPTLTLNPPLDHTVECSPGTYADPGYASFDACVGGPVPVTVTGAVDMKVKGVYTLTYQAKDLSGQTSAPQDRTVRVLDSRPPVVTINGSNVIKIECNVGVYEELGATAMDICAGERPVSTSGVVTEELVGAYLVKYTATDLSGNTGEAVRNVLVEDHLPPEITLNDNTPGANTHECGSGPYNDPGVSLADVCDSPTTWLVEFTDLQQGIEGNYIWRYQARDSWGNTSYATRNLTVKDRLPPQLIVASPTEEIECGSQPSLGVTASDQCYGDLTSSIVQTPATIPSVPGDHVVTYTVVDPAGNSATSAATRVITVVDTGMPVLSVNGPTEIYYECTGQAVGNVWNNPGATATDSCEGELIVHMYNSGDDDGDGFPGCDPEVPVYPCDPDDFGPGPTTEFEGLYYVQYLAWDASWNIQGAILSVYVQDTTKPMLFLNGPEYATSECFLGADDPSDPDKTGEVDPFPYVDQGAIGDDMCYGDVTPSVMTFGEVNKLFPGTYTLEYQVRDGAFNWADPIVRTVEVLDSQNPKIVKLRDVAQPASPGFMRTVDLSECAIAWDQCEGYMDVNAESDEEAAAFPLTVVETTGAAVPPGDIEVLDNSSFRVRAVAGRVYEATFRVTDVFGNTATTSSGTCRVVIAEPTLVLSPTQDSTTADNTPTYTGTAQVGWPSVKVFVDDVEVATVPIDAAGNWTFTPTAPLAEGEHRVYAVAVSPTGVTNRSTWVEFVVDTTPMTASSPTEGSGIAGSR